MLVKFNDCLLVIGNQWKLNELLQISRDNPTTKVEYLIENIGSVGALARNVGIPGIKGIGPKVDAEYMSRIPEKIKAIAPDVKEIIFTCSTEFFVVYKEPKRDSVVVKMPFKYKDFCNKTLGIYS